MLSERNDPLVGAMLGKDYRVLQAIGAGGMAVVYLVEHQTLLKQFAAKVLSLELASSLEARARFAQEAHAASQLDHENIVSISDFGVTPDQRPFFVMELLRGKPLDQRLAEGQMTLEEVVAVAVPVARALAHAHAEGVIHLDIKPENIFLVQRSQGRWGVKVVDFGIAKTPQNPKVTKAGETAGSPMFMAPEVCQGADDIDQRADVYAFGILLYLMLCGQLPFVDEDIGRVLTMQLVELPAPPREINHQLSPELAAIIERALAKRREDRYPSMTALLHDFEAALPPGADRLLIESQSGASLTDTPFPRALSLGLSDGHAPVAHSMPPSGLQPMHAAHPVPSSGLLASQPPAPRRRRLAIVLIAALATILLAMGGALAWEQMTHHRLMAARRSVPPSPSSGTAAVAAVVPHVEPIEPEPPPAAKPVAPDVPAAAAAIAGNPPAQADIQADQADEDDAPAVAPAPEPVAPAASERGKPARVAAITKPVRPKQIAKREPPKPAKRVAAAPAAGSAARTAPAAVAAIEPPRPAPAAEPAPAAVAAIEPPRPAPEAEPAPASSPTPAPAIAAPVPPVPLSPAPAPAAPPPSAGTLDAVPAVTSLDVKGSLSPSIVRRGVERSLGSLRNCYRTAAKAGGATPAIDLQLTFEIDENGLATQVGTKGAQFGTLASCAASVASQIRTQEAPDVGTVQVSVGIRFRPS